VLNKKPQSDVKELSGEDPLEFSVLIEEFDKSRLMDILQKTG
jgi:hypothetical protein